MKIHIIFEFVEGPWGGGNQFLKALKNEFIKMNVYSENISEANVILFNSHHFLEKVKEIKLKYPEKVFIHRIDGPVQLARGSDEGTDKIIFKANNSYANGTVFQSQWIKNETEKLGFTYQKPSQIIINAPNSDIFYKKSNIELENYKKMKIISTSWSGNIRKGFDVYQWLDKNFDFNLFEMTFVGNSPITFKNITHKKPMTSAELANELRQHHVYLTASKYEPCSNALIEAMHCGLPALAYDNGGNPEIVGNGGELFIDNSEIIEKLNKIKKNYISYCKKIDLLSIKQVANKYYKLSNFILKNNI